MKRLTLVIAALALLAAGAASPMAAEEREAYQWQGHKPYADNIWGIWSLTYEPSSNPQIFWGNWYRGEDAGKTYNYGTMEGVVDIVDGGLIIAHGTWTGNYDSGESGTWEGVFGSTYLGEPCIVKVTRTSPSPTLTETYHAPLCVRWPSNYTYYTPSWSFSDAYGYYLDQAIDAGGSHISFVDRSSGSVYYTYMTWDGQFSGPDLIAQGVVKNFDYLSRCTSIDYDPLGYPHISYTDDNTTEPRHAWKNQNGWHIEPMWNGHGILSGNSFTAIAIDKKTGILHACGDRNGELWYGTRSPSGAWTASMVQAANVGAHCDIAVGANGIPQIVYQEIDENGHCTKLKYATKVNGQWVTMDVDGTLDYHSSVCPSITVDRGGNPHIAYSLLLWNQTLRKYAYYNGSWIIEIVDSNDGDHSPTSITIDNEGHPIILYCGGKDFSEYPYSGPTMCRRIGTNQWQSEVVDIGTIPVEEGIAVGIKNSGSSYSMVCCYYDRWLIPTPPTIGYSEKLRVAVRVPWTGGSQSPVAAVEDAPSAGIQPAIDAITNSTVGSVDIRYQLPNQTKISISVYDVTGRPVKTLYSGQQTSGSHQLTWDGVDDAGRNVSSGVYIVHMKAGEFQAREKVTIIR